MTEPTIIEQSSAAGVEAAKAKWWRVNVVKLSRSDLSRRTGYSVNSIDVFERGYRYDGTPIKARAWVRYRAVCAGLHMVGQFDWRDPEASWGDYEVSGKQPKELSNGGW